MVGMDQGERIINTDGEKGIVNMDKRIRIIVTDQGGSVVMVIGIGQIP